MSHLEKSLVTSEEESLKIGMREQELKRKNQYSDTEHVSGYNCKMLLPVTLWDSN